MTELVSFLGIALSQIAIVKPDDAIINNEEFTPKLETADWKSISPTTGSKAIMSSVDTDIGIDSEIQKIKHADRIPIARICSAYSLKANEMTTDKMMAANPKIINRFLFFFISLVYSQFGL